MAFSSVVYNIILLFAMELYVTGGVMALMLSTPSIVNLKDFVAIIMEVMA